jgi:hypothetical protein
MKYITLQLHETLGSTTLQRIRGLSKKESKENLWPSLFTNHNDDWPMWWHLIQNPKPIFNWVPSSVFLSLHDPIFHVYWWGWKNNLHTILDIRDTWGVGGDAIKALVSSVPFDLRLTPISQNSQSKKHLQVCKDVSFCRIDIAPCHCSYCVFGFYQY